MSESDEELRNIKLAQINGAFPAFSNILDESSSFAIFEQVSFCDGDEQPSSTTITTCPSEQKHATRESSTHSHEINGSQNINNCSNQSNDVHHQSSLGSLELAKQAVKYCFTESQSMFHSSSSFESSNMHNSNQLGQDTIPLKFSDDEEQKSLIPPPPILQQNISTSSIESTLSTPGAFRMKGSNFTGRAQVGMITPQYDSKEKSFDKAAEGKKPPLPALASLRIVLDEQNEDLSPSLSLSNIDGIERKEEKKREKKKLLCIVGISFFVFFVVILVVVVPSFVHPQATNASDELPPSTTNNDKNNNTKLFGDWSDLISECDNQGRIDFSMLDSIAMIQYQDLQRQFLPNQQAEVESCSPQQLALLSLSIHSDRNTNKSDISGEEYSVSSASLSRYILSVFFFSLQGNEWRNNFEWLEPRVNECQWFGVMCSLDNDQIIGLDLGGNNLVGTIPDEIYQLTNLQKIWLPNNDHLGAISPMGIQNLTKLQHFNVLRSSFSGPFPSELFALPELLSLGLPQTSPPTTISGSDFAMLSGLTSLTIVADVLGGSIPTEIGLLTSLKELVISGFLSGRIPHELAFLPALEELRVGGGLLTGTIPETLFEQNKQWRRIGISSNALTGSIPSLIGTQEQLETLDLDLNGLSGSIPFEISNCSSLKTLFLSNNRLEGTIPTEIGRMSALESLNLNTNRLTGALPTEIAGLENLKFLFVTPCQGLSGTISHMFCENEIEVKLITRSAAVCDDDDPLWISCQQETCCDMEDGE